MQSPASGLEAATRPNRRNANCHKLEGVRLVEETVLKTAGPYTVSGVQIPGPPPSGVGVVRSISSCDLEGPGANPVTPDHFFNAVECKESSGLFFKQDLVGASPTNGAMFCAMSMDSNALAFQASEAGAVPAWRSISKDLSPQQREARSLKPQAREAHRECESHQIHFFSNASIVQSESTAAREAADPGASPGGSTNHGRVV